MLKSMNILCLFCLLVVIMSGCISAQRRDYARTVFEQTIPVCSGDKDCKEKWEAAQVWVAKNCGMKLQIANDTIIETYNSPAYSINLAARVVKEPLGGGQYKIEIKTWCSNLFRCEPDALSAAVQFNKYVGNFGTQAQVATEMK
jgi:hypothetical protein